MSWGKTYSHTLAIAVDDLAAAVLFNEPDLTVSSLCRLAQLGRLAPLKLSAWQVRLLTWLAPRLDRLQAHHCELARLADLERGRRMATLLADA